MHKVIDAHHHIWRQKDIPWLLDGRPRIFGDYTALRRDYPIEEFLEDTAPCHVVKSVYLQANWGHGREVEEARWVDEVGKKHGMPTAQVAHADLDSPDLGKVLDEYARLPSVHGIRQHLQWHKNPLLSGYVPVPDLFDQKAWRAGLREIGDRGYTFDLQVYPGQMQGAAAMAADFPDITFILLHAGMLDSRDDETVATWKAGMKALGAQPNVYVKLTGLGTFDHQSTLELVRPLVQVSLECFGAGRCIYGSNFPIEKLWTNYQTYFKNVNDALGNIPDADRQAVFYDNAEKVYRLAQTC